MRKYLRSIGASAAVAAAFMAAPSFAQTGNSYGDILTGLDSATAVTAVIGAGALLAGVGFAKWATKKVATFFG
jgi:hypothetical protein